MCCNGVFWQWIAVAVIVVVAVWLVFGRRHRGNSCCGDDRMERGGGCSGCPLSGGCRKEECRDCDKR